MTRRQRPDAVIAEFFRQPQPDLPDRVFDLVRGDIHRTPQRFVLGRLRMHAAPAWRTTFAVAAIVLALAAGWFGLSSYHGPAGVPPSPTPRPSPSQGPDDQSGALPSPTGPTVFTSPLYGYTVTLPAGWSVIPAMSRWSGTTQPAFGSIDTDGFDGPRQVIMLAFAGPYDRGLSALVDDRIGANARDHADTCPLDALQVNEPIDVAGQAGDLLGWNCGGLVNQALTVRDGIAYAFSFRDLDIKAARDPTDLALLRSLLDSVRLPTTPPTPGP